MVHDVTTSAMLVLLAGSSCTGKSTFVSALRKKTENVITIGQDEFYDWDSFQDNTCPMVCGGRARGRVLQICVC